MVTLVSWKNFLKKKSLWTILSFDQRDKIPFIRIDRSLISKVDMKIGEKPIRGRNFYLRERNIGRIDILFFFKLLYGSLLLHYRGYNCAIDFTKRRQEMAMPISTLRFTFPEGKWRNSLIRVTVSLFCWGKEGKGG